MKKKFFQLFLFHLLFYSMLVKSQTSIITKWGYSYGNACGASTCFDIKTDLNGNHITCGNIYMTFNTLFDLDPSPTATFPTNTSLFLNQDFYICKYAPNGNFISGIVVGGSGQDVCTSIAIDNGNNIIATGFFNGTVDFDPSVSVSNLTSNGAEDIFIAKYTNTGVLLWAKSMGTNLTDKPLKVVTDNQNNIYFTTNFSGTLDIDPSTAVVNVISNGATDVCIAKFSPSGNLIMGGSFGDTGADQAYDIVLDQGKKLFMTGTFLGSVDFNPSLAGATILNNVGGSGDPDGFVSKFDSLLSFQWAKAITHTRTVVAQDINIDNTGNILLTGYFVGFGVDLDMSPIGSATFSAIQNNALWGFNSKYDSNGNYLWAGVFGNTDMNYNKGFNIWSDNLGNVYSLGTMIGVVDFDLSPSSTFTVSSGGSPTCLYLSKYSSSGNFISADKLSTGYIFPSNAHADNNGDVLISGNIVAPVLLTQNVSLSIISCGLPDSYAFISKFTYCNLPVLSSVSSSTNGVCANTGSINLSVINSALNSAANWEWSAGSCNGSTVGVGNSIVVTPTANTIYYVKGIGGCVGNSMACYSVNITTIPAPTLSIISSSNVVCPNTNFTLTASAAPTYSWNNGNTTQSFVATASVSTNFSVSTTGTNGCVGSQTFSQNVFTVQPLTRSTFQGGSYPSSTRLDSLCSGESVNIQHVGGSQYTLGCNFCNNNNSSIINTGFSIGVYLYLSNLQSNLSYTINSVDPNNGCTNSQSYTINVFPCTGINEFIQLDDALIYPNPTDNYVSIKNEKNTMGVITIRNTLGQVLFQYPESDINTEVKISLKDLPSGIYFIDLKKHHHHLTKKIIKN